MTDLIVSVNENYQFPPPIMAMLEQMIETRAQQIAKGEKGDPGGWALTNLGNVSLDTILTSGLYTQNSSLNATLANGYPFEGGNWIIEVTYAIASGNNVIQRATVVTSNGSNVRGFYQRRRIGGVFEPWHFFSSTRIDNTAGKRVFQWDNTANRELMIYGDTGWRDISEYLPEGLKKSTAGNATAPTIRRFGDRVSVTLYLDVLAEGITAIFALPVGFRPKAALIKPGTMYSATTPASQHPQTEISSYVSKASGIRSSTALQNNSTIIYYAEWETDDVWPPSPLPGIQA